MAEREKRKAESQDLLVLLNQLALNVLMWARRWLNQAAPKLVCFSIMRLVRDLMNVSGKIELNQRNSSIKCIILNRAALPATKAFTELLKVAYSRRSANNYQEGAGRA